VGKKKKSFKSRVITWFTKPFTARGSQMVSANLEKLHMLNPKTRRRNKLQDDEYSSGYTVKDSTAYKADMVATVFGRIMILVVYIGIFLMAVSIILGFAFGNWAGSPSTDFGEQMADLFIAALLGFIGGPVVLSWFVVVPIGAIIGMQMVSRWGFLASIPFIFWIVGGTWTPVINVYNDMFHWNIPTFSFFFFENPTIYGIGFAIALGLMILVGVLSGVSFAPRDVQIEQYRQKAAMKKYDDENPDKVYPSDVDKKED
jgi:MFS family permease